MKTVLEYSPTAISLSTWCRIELASLALSHSKIGHTVRHITV